MAREVSSRRVCAGSPGRRQPLGTTAAPPSCVHVSPLDHCRAIHWHHSPNVRVGWPPLRQHRRRHPRSNRQLPPLALVRGLDVRLSSCVVLLLLSGWCFYGHPSRVATSSHPVAVALRPAGVVPALASAPAPPAAATRPAQPLAAPSPSNPAPLANFAANAGMHTAGPRPVPWPGAAPRPPGAPAHAPSFPRLAGLPLGQPRAPGSALPIPWAVAGPPAPTRPTPLLPLPIPLGMGPAALSGAAAPASAVPALRPVSRPAGGGPQVPQQGMAAGPATQSPSPLLAPTRPQPLVPAMPAAGAAAAVPPPAGSAAVPGAVLGMKRKADAVQQGQPARILPVPGMPAVGVPMLPHPAAAATAVVGQPIETVAGAGLLPPPPHPSPGHGGSAQTDGGSSDDDEAPGAGAGGEAQASEAASAAAAAGGALRCAAMRDGRQLGSVAERGKLRVSAASLSLAPSPAPCCPPLCSHSSVGGGWRRGAWRAQQEGSAGVDPRAAVSASQQAAPLAAPALPCRVGSAGAAVCWEALRRPAANCNPTATPLPAAIASSTPSATW